MHRILIDANNIFHRLFHVLKRNEPEFCTDTVSREMLINRSYNFMKSAMRDYPSDDVWICADSPYDTWRKGSLDGYKSNRSTDKIFVDSCVGEFILRCRKVGISTVELSGFEADDILYSVSKSSLADGISIMIITSDSDMHQLLHFTDFNNPYTFIYDPDYNKKCYYIHPSAEVTCKNMTMFDMDGLDSILYDIVSNQQYKTIDPHIGVIKKFFCGDKTDCIPSCFQNINGKNLSLGEARAESLSKEFSSISQFYDEKSLRLIASRILSVTNCKDTDRIDEIISNMERNRRLIHLSDENIQNYNVLNDLVKSTQRVEYDSKIEI